MLAERYGYTAEVVDPRLFFLRGVAVAARSRPAVKYVGLVSWPPGARGEGAGA